MEKKTKCRRNAAIQAEELIFEENAFLIYRKTRNLESYSHPIEDSSRRFCSTQTKYFWKIRVISPRTLLKALKRTFHLMNADRDEMWPKASNYGWPYTYCKNMMILETWKECQAASKKLKTRRSRQRFEHILRVDWLNRCFSEEWQSELFLNL